MSQYSPSVDKSRSLDGGDENAERTASDLPERADPHRPPLGADEASMVYKRLNNDLYSWDDLTYRQHGLLVIHRPWLYRDFVEDSL